MSNFEMQMNEAIAVYAELDGRSFQEILEECRVAGSQTEKIIQMLMFAAA